MSGTYSASSVGVSFWTSPSLAGSTARASGSVELVQLAQRVLAHHDDDARLHDRDLLGDARAALGRRQSSVSGTGHLTNSVP